MNRRLLIIGFSLSLFPVCAVASAQIKPVIAHRSSADSTSDFRFSGIPSPSVNDKAEGKKFVIIEGKQDSNSAGIEALTDGRVPSGADAREENFFFADGTDGGRLRLDLGATLDVKQVNTYSWHTNDRAPQVYKLYAADGLAKDFNAAPSRRLDPTTCGWKLIADVDARSAGDHAGGQYGVSIGDGRTAVAHGSYLLFDVRATERDDLFGNTFYSEIDVISGDEPLKPASVRAPRTPISSPSNPSGDEARAREVMESLQARFWRPRDHYYADRAGTNGPASMWSDGVALSALNGAIRHDRQTYAPVFASFYESLNRNWDYKQKIPGYEPFPGNGDGHDKYYDDNEWIAIALLENYAESNRTLMLQRSTEVVDFSLSGWDDVLGGGIWWHEKHNGNSKNTCSNAPAAVACLRLAQYLPSKQAAIQRAMAKRIVEWTVANLQDQDKLFTDNISAIDRHVARFRLTYNSALMIRAELGLYRATGDAEYLTAAKQIAAAADQFTSKKTGGYRDAIRFSHLLVEADLAMVRANGDPHLLSRARHAVDADYSGWQSHPTDELLDVAALARELWLLAESHSPAGEAFWRRVDGPIASPPRG